ncbi:winged helix-turn-helix domain-containing protein [Oceanimonas sp. NS1]|nr:winged helix-turn-helix domain-containing protein [Oceanimonas sp. NS1]
MSALFHLDRSAPATLQRQVREQLVSAILEGFMSPDSPLPSCRNLAKNLNVSRNTVVLVYDSLVADGYLVSRERHGYFVNPHFQAEAVGGTGSGNGARPGPAWTGPAGSRLGRVSSPMPACLTTGSVIAIPLSTASSTTACFRFSTGAGAGVMR